MKTFAKFAICTGVLVAVVPAFAAQPNANTPAPPNAAPPAQDAVFTAWDTDKNRTLSPEEFRAGWTRMTQAVALRGLKAQFDRNDKNRDGAIEASEFATLDLVRQAGASAPPIVRFDTDKNGRLDFKEYANAVAAMAQPRPQPSKQ